MRSIHTLFTLLFSAMGICAVAMFTVTLKVADLRQESRQYQNQLYQYYRLSHELKQSSDHLTKFARAYSVTGDPYWVELFNHVLHVRNGQSSIPKGNDYEYWDVVSSESTLFTGHNDLASKPLFDRIRRSGIAPVEFLELKNALMLSDELVLLEREALMAVKGFKKGEDGEFTDLSSPDLEHARSLLYGKKYFSEKAKIMSAIGASHTAIVERIEAQIGVVSKKEARYAMVSSVLVATLLSIIILSFILLWRLYIGPLSQMLKTVVSHVNRQDYAFTLTQKAYAELQQFIDSLNIVFHHIAEQLSHNTLDKDFNIVMRTNQSTQSLCQGVTQFILRQFPIEMVGIYIHRDSELKRISGVGYGDGIITLTQDASSTHMGVLMSGRPYSMKKLQGKYHIELSGGQLEINEIYYLPLWVNDQPVALLEIGTLHELSHQQYQQLTQMLDDLSVSIQLSQNVEMQRAAEQKVMEQSQLNQEILNATPNPMYCLSPNGQYLTVNAKFCDLVELSMPEVLGKTPGEIFDTKAANTFSEAHKALSLKQGNQDYELMLEDQAGKQKTLLVNEASFDNPQGQIDGIVGILLDLTDRKQMEEDLREAKENAVAVSRAKGDFLANMSHEIRTPMNAILGMAHLALDTELDATQRNYISRINQSAKNLLGVIDDILDFSKIEAGKLAVENISFNLNEVLNNLTSVISLKAQDKGMEFLLDIDPEIPAGLMGDPLRLGQVLVNLCGNAVKFTEEGEVMVSCSLVQESGDSVTLRFLVKDTGVGINRDKIDTLFTSFSQADTSITRQFGGTGLGLSISKQLVELMHGELSVESVEGQGSIFSFTIVCGQQEAKIRDRFQPINALAGKRALIVDDNQSARNIMLTLLTTMHFEAKAVSNGFEALDELQNSQFDMIFADWNMPGMNGLELFKKAKDQQLAQQARHF
nr:ATP-binding protein [Endozoicomonas sp.]